jgi:hypothetical protein
MAQAIMTRMTNPASSKDIGGLGRTRRRRRRCSSALAACDTAGKAI